MVDFQDKRNAKYKSKIAVSQEKSRDHHRYSKTTPLRPKSNPKRLPLAIHPADVLTHYPVEVEELCRVLEDMLKRRLAEVHPVTDDDELTNIK